MSTKLLSNLLPNLLARLTLAAVESTHPVQFGSTIQRRSTYFQQHLRAHARSHVQVPVFKSPPRASGPVQRPLARVLCNVLSDIQLPFQRFAFCAASSFLSPIGSIHCSASHPSSVRHPFQCLATVLCSIMCSTLLFIHSFIRWCNVKRSTLSRVSSVLSSVQRPRECLALNVSVSILQLISYPLSSYHRCYTGD